MKKEEINLLSPDVLAAKAQQRKDRNIRTILHHVLYALVLVGCMYGVMWGYFYTSSRQLGSQIVTEYKEESELQSRITAINTKTQAIDATIASYPNWTSRIEDVLRVVPAGITVTVLELQSTPSALGVTGIALEGASVVEYQKALEALPWVDHVVAPLQNFARSKGVTAVFTIVKKEGGSL